MRGTATVWQWLLVLGLLLGLIAASLGSSALVPDLALARRWGSSSVTSAPP